MQTTPDDQIIKKARPFFLNYFKRLENDLNTLTSAPVTCTIGDVSLSHGRDDLEQAFEVDRAVAQVMEDGTGSGDMHILMDVSTAIALSGLMMMMGEAVIRELVKNRKYTDEIQEGFQEVANQTVGALNDLFEKKVAGGHLTLVLPTSYVQYGDFCSTLQEDGTYLQVVSNIQIGNFPAAPTTWLASRKVVEALLGVVVAGTATEQAQEQAQQSSSGAAAGDGSDGGGGSSGQQVAASAAHESSEDSAQSGGAQSGSSSQSSPSSASVAASASPAQSTSSQPDASSPSARQAAAATAQATAASRQGQGAMLDDDEATQVRLPGIGIDGVAKETLLPSRDDGSDLEVLDGYSGAAGSNTRLELPKLAYSTNDGLPAPDEPGGVKAVMTEPPFSMPGDERVMKAINAMRYEGVRYIGVESQGKLVRIISQSDLRQIMGPFFGTKAMSARDKAICTLAISKLNQDQQLVTLPIGGTIQQAAQLLTEYSLRMLPIISKQGVLRGFVPVHAVLDYFRRKKQK
ncbi:MAG: CBS domain-containing protein [Magnetococcales bacterium]|nr:CBS domain-containing protein [Magnetococcales bacterium]